MKIINFKLLTVICLVFMYGCAQPEICNLDNQGENIVCFGDSITFGYGASAGEDYPSALAKCVRLPVINAGVDGDTTFEALERLQQDVLNKNPRLVIVEFCGNDFLRKVPRKNTVENLGIIIDRIQAAGAAVALVDISAGGVFLDEYRKDFKKLAMQKKVIFVPAILHKIITNSGMKSDFFHPNARGYKLIAQRVYKSIAEYVK
jgi:lysophospholipase L1-like esterase